MIGLKVQAQKTSEFIFISKEGEKFFLIFDGEKKNELPSENVKVEKVKSGTHLLKIIFENNNLKPINQEIKTWVSNGYIKERKFIIDLNKKKELELSVLSSTYYEGTSALDAFAESLDETAKVIEENKKEPCEKDNFGKYEFENKSNHPYNLFINGKFIKRMESNAVSIFNIPSGSCAIKVEQVTGFLVYPTVKEVNIKIENCKLSGKYSFPF